MDKDKKVKKNFVSMPQSVLNEAMYSIMVQVKFVEDSLYKIRRGMFCFGQTIPGRPYPFKFFKGCLPQIFLGPFLNTLSQICLF